MLVVGPKVPVGSEVGSSDGVEVGLSIGKPVGKLVGPCVGGSEVVEPPPQPQHISTAVKSSSFHQSPAQAIVPYMYPQYVQLLPSLSRLPSGAVS